MVSFAPSHSAAPNHRGRRLALLAIAGAVAIGFFTGLWLGTHLDLPPGWLPQ